MKPITLILLVSLTATSDFALALNEASELDYYQEIPIVLSASRLSQPLSDAPNAMTVIDRKMIVASGFRAIPDIFKLVPGMYVSYYKGSQAFVSYHGSTDQYARRMQVMIDGRSVYLAPVSAVDWANLPIMLDDIERIEVIRGPAAASHGANSTQGVISITTRDSGSLNGKSVSFTRGSKGVNDVVARFGKAGERFDYRMTIGYSADNGYDDLNTSPNGLPQASLLLNNGYDSNQARLMNFRADYHPNEVDSFDIQFGLNRDVQGVGFTDKNPTVLNPNSTNWNVTHDLHSESGFLQFGWLRALEDGAELKMHYYHIRQNQHEAFPYYYNGTLSNSLITQSVLTSRDELEIQHLLQTNDNNRLVYGAAWRGDRTDAQQYVDLRTAYGVEPSYSSTSNSAEYRVFAHDEWHIAPTWILNVGAMFEKDGWNNSNASPRVALNYHLAPQHTIRLDSSVAYRTPALVEKQYPEVKPGIVYQPGALFVPSSRINSPSLQPERMDSKAIGYVAELSDWHSTLDVRVFNDRVTNGIYIAQSEIFANGLNSNLKGVEITLKHNFDSDTDLTVNFAHSQGESNAPALVAAGNSKLNPADSSISDVFTGSIPINSGSLLYSHRQANGFSYSAAYYHQDAMQPFDRGSIDRQPVQRRMDARIAQPFRGVAGMKGEVALVIQNLFDQRYTEYIANNVFDRRAHITIRVDW
ncbi:MAG: TonB-dependent receptor [Sideroxydans sp.]|nr:TonB-dependent receptor [Sideroxydans sp.]